MQVQLAFDVESSFSLAGRVKTKLGDDAASGPLFVTLNVTVPVPVPLEGMVKLPE